MIVIVLKSQVDFSLPLHTQYFMYQYPESSYMLVSELIEAAGRNSKMSFSQSSIKARCLLCKCGNTSLYYKAGGVQVWETTELVQVGWCWENCGVYR